MQQEMFHLFFFLSHSVIQKLFGKGVVTSHSSKNEMKKCDTQVECWGTATKRAGERSFVCLSVLGQHFQTPPHPHAPMKKLKIKITPKNMLKDFF
jgi:hypothetical protein